MDLCGIYTYREMNGLEYGIRGRTNHDVTIGEFSDPQKLGQVNIPTKTILIPHPASEFLKVVR